MWVATWLMLAAACGDSTGSGGAGAGGGSSEGGTPATGGAGGSGPAVPTAAECTATCEDAVANQCVQVPSGCAECCDAGLGIPDCLPEVAAFHECSTSVADPCQAPCDDVTAALTACLQTYCASNLDDPACTTLAGCRMPGGAGGAG